MCLNIQGLANNVNILEIVAVNKNLDVICLASHWLNTYNLNLACLPEYSVAASCRKNKSRGGSAIFITSNVTSKSVPFINGLVSNVITSKTCLAFCCTVFSNGLVLLVSKLYTPLLQKAAISAITFLGYYDATTSQYFCMNLY